MGAIETQCPTCHAQFVVPGEFVNRRARCKRCGQDFIIKIPDLEDTIADWLNEEEAAPTGPASKPAKASPKREAAAASTAGKPRPTPAPQAIAEETEPRERVPQPEESLRLSHVDALGAFFLFSPSLLRNPAFRSSIPRCCLGCGSTNDLHVHLVRWQSVRNDRGQAKHEDPGPRAKIAADELMRLDEEALLRALPRVSNSPPPFDLPIPYFICNRCSPVGAIITHVRPTLDGEEVCEIGIASLKRAAQFLARNLGRDHRDYQRLVDEINSGRANPWNSLPLAVRNRIDRWYKPDESERFVAYMRDTDFAKAEAGLGGLVITDKRLIYKKFASHRELLLDNTVEMSVERAADHCRLTLSTRGVKPAVLHCDSIIIEAIRSSLQSLNAQYRLTT